MNQIAVYNTKRRFMLAMPKVRWWSYHNLRDALISWDKTTIFGFRFNSQKLWIGIETMDDMERDCQSQKFCPGDMSPKAWSLETVPRIFVPVRTVPRIPLPLLIRVWDWGWILKIWGSGSRGVDSFSALDRDWEIFADPWPTLWWFPIFSIYTSNYLLSG